VQVGFTDQTAVLVAEEEDGGGRSQAADLEQDEDGIVAM
jgi:hypothetical protein